MNLFNNLSVQRDKGWKEGVKRKNRFIYSSLPTSFFLVITNPITNIHPFYTQDSKFLKSKV